MIYDAFISKLALISRNSEKRLTYFTVCHVDLS